MTFDNYKEYLLYTYNSAHAAGKVVEIIEMVRNQPRSIPFDFEFNTVEGNKFIILLAEWHFAVMAFCQQCNKLFFYRCYPIQHSQRRLT